MSDPINHPAHYARSAVEPINAIEAWELGFHLGNAVKYLARAGHKGDALEDLKKARWYLDREIERRVKAGASDQPPVAEASAAERDPHDLLLLAEDVAASLRRGEVDPRDFALMLRGEDNVEALEEVAEAVGQVLRKTRRFP